MKANALGSGVTLPDLQRPLAEFCMYEWQAARALLATEASATPCPRMWYALAAQQYPARSLGRFACDAEAIQDCWARTEVRA